MCVSSTSLTQVLLKRLRSLYSGEEIVQGARELPRTPYNARTSNCEHFVMEARTGQRSSVQVRKGVFHAVFGSLGCAAAGAATGILAGGAVGFIPGAIVVGIVGAIGGAGVGIAGGVAVGIRAANKAKIN